MSTVTTSTAPAQSPQTIVTADDIYPDQEKETSTPDGSQVPAKEDQSDDEASADVKPGDKPADAPADDKDKAADKSKEQNQQVEITKPENCLLSDEHLEGVKAFAKEHKIDNATAQKILERENALAAEVEKALLGRQEQEITQWAKDVESDKELGGEKFKESCEFSRRALKAFGGDGIAQILNETGYGNHPEVVRLLSRIGRAMGDDKLIKGGNDLTPKEKPLEEIFYGKKTKE